MHESESALTELENFCVNRWKQTHPGYDIRFHTDGDIRHDLCNTYPDYVDVYDESPGIIKGQIGRYLMMKLYGGTYADVDVYPFCRIDLWIDPDDELITVVRENPGEVNVEMDYQFHSVPNHPVWDDLIETGVSKWCEHATHLDGVDGYRLMVFDTLGVHHYDTTVSKYTRRKMEPPTCSNWLSNWGVDECYTTHFSTEGWLPEDCQRDTLELESEQFMDIVPKMFV